MLIVVEVSAEISFKSPRTIFNFILKKNVDMIKVSRKEKFNFEENFTDQASAQLW